MPFWRPWASDLQKQLWIFTFVFAHSNWFFYFHSMDFLHSKFSNFQDSCSETCVFWSGTQYYFTICILKFQKNELKSVAAHLLCRFSMCVFECASSSAVLEHQKRRFCSCEQTRGAAAATLPFPFQLFTLHTWHFRSSQRLFTLQYYSICLLMLHSLLLFRFSFSYPKYNKNFVAPSERLICCSWCGRYSAWSNKDKDLRMR